MKALSNLDFGKEGVIAQGAEVIVGTQRNISARVITQSDVDHFVALGALPKPRVLKTAAKAKPAPAKTEVVK